MPTIGIYLQDDLFEWARNGDNPSQKIQKAIRNYIETVETKQETRAE